MRPVWAIVFRGACLVAAGVGLGLMLGILAIGVGARWPVPSHQWALIKLGASRDAVRSSLGEPSRVDDGGQVWQYSKAFCCLIAYVRFDTEGRVLLKEFKLR